MDRKKLKVIVATPVPLSSKKVGGGIGRWTNLVKRFAEQNSNQIDVDFIDTIPAADVTKGRSLWQRVVVQGFKMLKLNAELRKTICREKPDVLHITTSGQLAIIRDILFLKTAKKRKLPTVYHIHFGRIPEMCRQNTREWRMMKKALKLADIVMPLDAATAETIETALPGKSVTIMPNPVDVGGLSALKIGERKPSVLYLGWMVRTKGIEDLLHAWETVVKAYPNYTLDLVGSGDEAYIRSLKENAPAGVIFHGAMAHDAAMQRMAECAVFILPSHTEAFPNVILEAMVLAKPIISTSVGAIPDMLSGDCGVVIPVQDPAAIVAALQKLLSDPELCAGMAENAHRKVREMYDIDVVMRQTLATWHRCCETQRSFQ